MARAQSDSLRAVAEAQADWVKGLATAKALPRNAAYAPPPPPQVTSVDDDEADEDDEEEPAMPPWLEMINSIAPVVQTYGEVLKAKFAPAVPRNVAPPAADGPNGMIHLSEINACLSPIERKFLNLVLRGEGGATVTDELLAMNVREAVAFVKDQVARAQAERAAPSEKPAAPPPPGGDFTTHVLAGSAFLTAQERAAVMWLLPRFSPARVEELKTQLLAATPHDAAMWIRDNLDALRAEVAS